MSRPPPTPAVIALAHRLRMAGVRLREIGAEIGYSRSGVQGMLARHRPDWTPRLTLPPTGGRYPLHVRHLTDAQRETYRIFRRKAFPVAEALAAAEAAP